MKNILKIFILILVFSQTNPINSALILIKNNTSQALNIKNVSTYKIDYGAEHKNDIKMDVNKIFPKEKIIMRKKGSKEAANIRSFIIENKLTTKKIWAPNRGDFLADLKASDIFDVNDGMFAHKGIYIQNIPATELNQINTNTRKMSNEPYLPLALDTKSLKNKK